MEKNRFSILIGEESKENPGTYRISFVDNDSIWATRSNICEFYNKGFNFINIDKCNEIMDLEARFKAQEEEKALTAAKSQESKTV